MSFKWLQAVALFCLLSRGLAVPIPDDDPPAEGGDKPAEGGDKPAEGGDKPAEGGDKPAEGDDKPTEGGDKPAEGGETTAAADDKPTEGETTPAPDDNAEKLTGESDPNAETTAKDNPDKPAEDTTTPAEGETTVETETGPTILLTMEFDALPPANAFTDKYGKPIKISEMKNITLPGGGIFNLVTEEWKTYHTFPPVIPGCQCITRGPLSRFKLIGNIHFPKIKVTPERYVTVPTEPSSTLCPPCECPTCTGVPANY